MRIFKTNDIFYWPIGCNVEVSRDTQRASLWKPRDFVFISPAEQALRQ